jgi:hypothetical protein
LYWSETGERQLFGADIISEAEKAGPDYQGKLEDRLVYTEELCRWKKERRGLSGG